MSRLFHAVKGKTAPILGFADFTQPFTLETDASKHGLGAVLSQQQGDSKCITAYASRRLRDAEKNDRNYCSIKKNSEVTCLDQSLWF